MYILIAFGVKMRLIYLCFKDLPLKMWKHDKQTSKEKTKLKIPNVLIEFFANVKLVFYIVVMLVFQNQEILS